MLKVQLVETRRLKLQVSRTRLVCFVLFVTWSHAVWGWGSNHLPPLILSQLYLQRRGWMAKPVHHSDGRSVVTNDKRCRRDFLINQNSSIGFLNVTKDALMCFFSKRLKWTVSHFSAAARCVLTAASGVIWTDGGIMSGSRRLPCSHHSAVATLA